MKAVVSNQERKLRTNFGGNVDLSSQPDLVYLRKRSRTTSANTSSYSSPSNLSRAMSTISLPNPFFVSIYEKFTVKPFSMFFRISHFSFFHFYEFVFTIQHCDGNKNMKTQRKKHEDFGLNRSQSIYLNTFNIRSDIWRRSFAVLLKLLAHFYGWGSTASRLEPL